MSEDTMARDHRRDYAAERAMTDVIRSIDALLVLPHNRVPPKLAEKLVDVHGSLKDQCAHIVRVWD